MELVIFGILVGVGGAVWFFLNYILAILFNWYQVMYPTYYTDPVVTTLVAFSEWGLLFVCLIPAIIYLITNTQRPEVPR
jgi:hypothetical protein